MVRLRQAARTPSPKAKRARVDLTTLGRVFIDTYLPMYISLSGNTNGRSNLYSSILKTAELQKETLNSYKWTTKVVSERLHNALKAHNKAAKAAAGTPEEAAPGEAAPVE